MECDIFISHVEEDEADARALAGALREQGYSVWIYEEHQAGGVDYTKQTARALKECRAVLVLISRATLESQDVESEIHIAYRKKKKLMPVLKGMTYKELGDEKEDWEYRFGAAIAVEVPQGGVARVIERVVAGLQEMGITGHVSAQEKPDRSGGRDSEGLVLAECARAVAATSAGTSRRRATCAF